LNLKGTGNNLLSTRERWHFWFGAWAVVALVSMLPHPSQILFAPFFPVGLLALLPHGEDKAIEGWMQVFSYDSLCSVATIPAPFESIGAIRVSKFRA